MSPSLISTSTAPSIDSERDTATLPPNVAAAIFLCFILLVVLFCFRSCICNLYSAASERCSKIRGCRAEDRLDAACMPYNDQFPNSLQGAWHERWPKTRAARRADDRLGAPLAVFNTPYNDRFPSFTTIEAPPNVKASVESSNVHGRSRVGASSMFYNERSPCLQREAQPSAQFSVESRNLYSVTLPVIQEAGEESAISSSASLA